MTSKEGKPQISEPSLINEQKMQEELLEKVTKTLKGMIDNFAETHKGKEFTADDIYDLYKQLNASVFKSGVFLDKYEEGADYDKEYRETSIELAEKLNKENKLSAGDKLLRGFSDFCNKIGLESIGAACLKHIEKVDLTSKLDVIAQQVAHTKVIDTTVNKTAKAIQGNERTR